MKLKVKGKEYPISSLAVSQDDMKAIYEASPEFNPESGLGKLSVNGYEFLFVTDSETGCRVCFSLNTNKKSNTITRENKKTGEITTIDLTPMWHFIRNVAIEDVTVKDKKGNVLTEPVFDNEGNPVMKTFVNEKGETVSVQETKIVTRPELLFGFSNHGSAKTGRGGNGNRISKGLDAFAQVRSEVEKVVTQPGIDALYNELYKGVRTFSLQANEETVENSSPMVPAIVEQKKNISVYIAEIDDASKELVYFISAPHWKEKNRKLNGTDGKTLYMVKESDLDKNEITIEELIATAKDENDLADWLKVVDAVAVRSVDINKANGKAIVTYYGEVDGKLKEDLKLDILDTNIKNEENLKTWTDNEYGKGKAEYTKSSVLTNGIAKHKGLTLGLIFGVAVLTAGHFIGSSIVRTNREQSAIQETVRQNKADAIASVVDETAKAKAFGAKQMAEFIGNKDLFEVVENADGSKSVEMRAAADIVKNPIQSYEQSAWPTYKNKKGETVAITYDDLSDDQKGTVDNYVTATIEGAYDYLGVASFDELKDKGYQVASYDSDNGYSPNLVYVVAADAGRDAYLSQDTSKEYLENCLGKGRGEGALTAYKTGYKKEMNNQLSNGGLKTENITQPASVQYNGPEVKTAVSNKTGDSATVFYVDGKVVSALSDDDSECGAGNVLYMFKLANNAKVGTTEDLAKAISEAEMTTGLSATYLFEGKGYDEVIGNFEDAFAKSNNVSSSSMFVFNTKLTNKGGKYSVDPDYVMLNDGGKSMTWVDNNVKVSADEGAKRDQYAMNAIALFGNTIINTYYSVENGTKESTTYNSNSVSIGDGSRAISASQDERSL